MNINPLKSLDVSRKVIDTMGKDAMCFNDREDGISCMNPINKKIYQATSGGTSVSRVINTPPSFDYQQEDFKVKVVNDNCRITTAGLGKEKEMSVLMCYKDNEHPELLDIGDNMKEMSEKIDEFIESI